jgi:hypothetical protein
MSLTTSRATSPCRCPNRSISSTNQFSSNQSQPTRAAFCAAPHPPKNRWAREGATPPFGGVCRSRRAMRTALGVAPSLARLSTANAFSTRSNALMAFIPRQVKPTARVPITCKLPEQLATLLKHYAAFVESIQEHIIGEIASRRTCSSSAVTVPIRTSSSAVKRGGEAFDLLQALNTGHPAHSRPFTPIPPIAHSAALGHVSCSPPSTCHIKPFVTGWPIASRSWFIWCAAKPRES